MSDSMSADEFNDMQAAPKASKYRNEKVEIDGHQFDSKSEGARYWDLRQRERAGVITELELQPAFPLLVQGVRIGVYKADFRYRDEGGEVVVEDVKSDFTRTNRLYRWKAKHVKAQYGIEIVEVLS